MVPSKLELCVTAALCYSFKLWTNQLNVVNCHIGNSKSINILLSKVQTMEEFLSEVLFLYLQITNVVLSISKVLFKYYYKHTMQCNNSPT